MIRLCVYIMCGDSFAPPKWSLNIVKIVSKIWRFVRKFSKYSEKSFRFLSTNNLLFRFTCHISFISQADIFGNLGYKKKKKKYAKFFAFIREFFQPFYVNFYDFWSLKNGNPSRSNSPHHFWLNWLHWLLEWNPFARESLEDRIKGTSPVPAEFLFQCFFIWCAEHTLLKRTNIQIFRKNAF